MPNNYQTIYFQLPAFLFNNYAYRKLGLSAKVTYALLQDRLKLSRQRHWQDEKGDVFIIFTNQELMDVLGLSEHTVIKIKQELTRFKLLRQKRMGINQPNRLYLPEPNLTPTDIYLPNHTEKTEIASQPPVKTQPNVRRRPVKKSGDLDFSQANFDSAEIAAQNKELLH
jgi:hypothetical protein